MGNRGNTLMHGMADRRWNGDEAYADYKPAIHDPNVVHVMLEDFQGP